MAQLQLAEKYASYKKQSLDPEKLSKMMSKECKKAKKQLGKMTLEVSFEISGRNEYFFIDKTLQKHLKLMIGKKASFKLANLKPKPRHANWRIHDLDTKRKFTAKLAHLKNFKFELTPSVGRKYGDQTPYVLTFTKFRHYTQGPKRSEFEMIGINPQARQLSLPTFDSTLMSDEEVSVYPGELKLPRATEEFERIFAGFIKENR